MGCELLALPKAELHLHLHGAMRPATVAELSAATGLTVADPRAFTDFAGFQVIYGAARACVTRPQHLRRVIAKVVEDAAADGVVWVQPHFDPYAYPEFGAAEQVLGIAVTAGWEAGARHGVGFGLTVAAMRHHGPDAAVELARFAAGHAGHGVHAFGLAGDEAAFPIEPFAPAFAIARDAGLTAAPHAGEMAGPGSVRAAVELLGARRIAQRVATESPLVGARHRAAGHPRSHPDVWYSSVGRFRWSDGVTVWRFWMSCGSTALPVPTAESLRGPSGGRWTESRYCVSPVRLAVGCRCARTRCRGPNGGCVSSLPSGRAPALPPACRAGVSPSTPTTLRPFWMSLGWMRCT